MLIKPPLTLLLTSNMFRTPHTPHTPLLSTETLKRAREIPFRRGVKKRQLVALLQIPVSADPHHHVLDIDLQRRRARVVHVQQCAVEFHVCAR